MDPGVGGDDPHPSPQSISVCARSGFSNDLPKRREQAWVTGRVCAPAGPPRSHSMEPQAKATPRPGLAPGTAGLQGTINCSFLVPPCR